MRMSMSRSIFAAVAVVGFAVSAPVSVQTAYAANGTTTAARGAPDIATPMPSQSIEKSALGSENLEAASSLNNRAELYHRQGRYAEAVPLLERALAIWFETLGPEHPKVANSRNSLGHLYRQQAQHAEAERAYRRALTIMEKALGREDANVAASRKIVGAQFHKSKPDTDSIQGGVRARMIRLQLAKISF